MKKKENQRIALTKRLLKESLIKLMAEKNIQQITVMELCQAAEINRSTFYNHYGCPQDVLQDIENSIIVDLEKIWEKEVSGKNWPLNKRVEALCTYILDNRQLFELLLRNSDTTSGFASLLMNAAHVRMTYDQVFSYGDNNDSKKLLITFLNNGAYYMIRQWILEDMPISAKEIGDIIMNIATHGWMKEEANSNLIIK
ncbi:MAG: TetR/AcrR family transcriptional regulator [Erysipelotrichaceae bacterium]